MAASEALRWECPGKVFLLGEYAVLAGVPAIALTFGPSFVLRASESEPLGPELPFSIHSPAGRLLERAIKDGARVPRLVFEDPWRGAGGFGASSAQFVLTFRALHALAGWTYGDPSEPEWLRCWKLYREFTSDAKVPPSGADVVAQCLGGLVAFGFEGGRPEAQSMSVPWRFLVFSATQGDASRKVATHTHLDDLARGGFLSGQGRFGSLLSDLRSVVREGLVAVRSGDATAFGRAMTAYADWLSAAGLEVDAAREDRFSLSEREGVLGVKGAGALQSDAIVVLLSDAEDREASDEVLAVAARRGLKLAFAR